MQLSKTQTFIGHRVANIISQKTHQRVNIDKVKYSLLHNKLRLTNIFIADEQEDTLLFAKKMEIKIKGINLISNNFQLEQIYLEEPYVKLITYNDSIMNILSFIDALSDDNAADTTNQSSYFFSIPQIQISNGRFAFQTYDRKHTDYGMNYNDLDFKNINAIVYNLHNIGDTIKMDINSLSTKEKCGLAVKKTQTNMLYTSGLLQFNNTHIRTRKSNLHAKHLKFSYNSEDSAWSKFTSLIHLDYLINTSRINLEELAFFNDNFREYKGTAIASTHATGTISNFYCKNIKARIYDNTYFKGNIKMHGLPQIFDTFFEGKIQHFQTTLEDIAKVKIPNHKKKYLNFPQHLDSLGILKYKGSYTGFLSDFVLYGKFDFQKHGTLLTDLSVKLPATKKTIEINGNVVSKELNLGKLLNNDKVGTTSMNIEIINGTQNEITEQNQATIKGVIENIYLYNYPYRNIQIDALLQKDLFNGNIAMQDKDIDFAFSGQIDKSTEIPQTSFSLEVKHADLSKLHLNKLTQDSTALVSFQAQGNSNGGQLDDISGKLKLKNLRYKNSKGTFIQDSIILTTLKKHDKRQVNIKSNMLDMDYVGNIQLSEIDKIPQRLLQNYINSFSSQDSIKKEEGNLLIILKDINPLLKVFLPDYEISNNTTITGQYTLDTINDIALNLCSEKIKIMNRQLYDIEMNLIGKDSLKNHLSIERVRLAKNFSLYNFNIFSGLAQDRMHTKLTWDNKQTLPYTGSLNMNSEFTKYATGKNFIINEILPSTFYIGGEDWHISNSKIILDSTSWVIDKLRVFNDETEFAELSGLISSTLHEKDMIYMELNSFDIKHLLGIIGMDALNLSGKMSGFGEYKKQNNKYTLETDLEVPNLLLEQDTIGKLQIYTDLKNNNEKLQTKASLIKKDTTKMLLEGNYSFPNDQLDYTLTFDKFDLHPTQPIFNNYISDLKGAIDGTISIQGTTEKPNINGVLGINVPNITTKINGVTYKIDDSIRIRDNTLFFENFNLTDPWNNIATLKGNFAFDIVATPSMNLSVTLQHLQALTNNYQPLAYGDAQVSANLKIEGDLDNLSINGNAQTDENSRIIIPLDNADEVDDHNFLQFINPKDSVNFIKSKDIDTQMATNSTLSYNVDINITPSTEIQVFLESKTGSSIKSKGKAALKITKNKYNKQRMMGEYTVSQGTFFYSFNGIINKKFDLEEGGTVKWDGSPEDAYLNLNAIYKVKTSITPLLFEQSNNSSRIIQTPVLCKIHISGKIEDPKLTFAIEFPSLDSTTKGNIESALQTTDISNQVLSLLFFNKFVQPEYMPELEQSNRSTDALSVTTSELLSSQISNILSQLSDDINIGFIYKPGDQLTKEEIGLALSTELLKNRVVISGNLGFSSDIENNRLNDFIGDFDLDIKIDKKGKLRFRGFSHTKDNLYYYPNDKNIQGVGIIYREEFNTFQELLKRYKKVFRF